MAPNRVALYGALARAVAVTALTFKVSPRIPRAFKWIIVFLLALNIRTFPLAWHFRILWPWYRAIINSRIAGYRGGNPGRLRLLTKTSPVGASPFGPVTVFKTRAGIADCDYNGHLSNSAFAKNVDFARMNACVDSFPGFSYSGGTLALGAAYYQFVKEIPLNSEYDIRVFIGGWESDKWLYLVAQFLTYPGKSTSKASKAAKAKEEARAAANNVLKDVFPPTPTPLQTEITSVSESTLENGSESEFGDASFAESGVLVPPPSMTAPTSGSTTPAVIFEPTGSQRPPNPSADLALPIPEGAVLHATVVSVYCFKHGRITVPPRVAMISTGFGSEKRWDQVQAWRKEGKLKAMLRGGWKEGTEAERSFWDFEEHEAEGNRKAEELKKMRVTLDAMGGK